MCVTKPQWVKIVYGSWMLLCLVCVCDIRADSRFVPSQWETALLCNDVSHWLGAHLESALWYVLLCLVFVVHVSARVRHFILCPISAMKNICGLLVKDMTCRIPGPHFNIKMIWSYYHLNSKRRFSVLIRWHLHIESRPWLCTLPGHLLEWHRVFEVDRVISSVMVNSLILCLFVAIKYFHVVLCCLFCVFFHGYIEALSPKYKSELGHHCFRYWPVACVAPSHYVNQCWVIVNWNVRNKTISVKFE